VGLLTESVITLTISRGGKWNEFSSSENMICETLYTGKNGDHRGYDVVGSVHAILNDSLPIHPRFIADSSLCDILAYDCRSHGKG
jgi:hypothetical protein